MELYYHKTDGGAEYYCAEYVECPNGEKEGLAGTALLRTDGNEIEVFLENCKKYGVKLVVRPEKILITNPAGGGNL